MQDQYAFDVGDFGKVGLLRHLIAGEQPLSLGVIWYATALGGVGDDGKHMGYLGLSGSECSANARGFRACDTVLYDRFRDAMLRSHPVRSIAALESLGVFPGSITRFHREPTQVGATRSAWFERALVAVRDTAVVLCDPDNGIANPGSRHEKSGSAKHVLLAELAELQKRGHALVIYHHLTREKGGHRDQMARWQKLLATRTGTPAGAVRYRRGTSRAFFVVPGARAPELVGRLEALRATPWVQRGHMELAML